MREELMIAPAASGAPSGHAARPYPHQGGCPECRTLRVCNVCGTPFKALEDRCTNGRCIDCHSVCCMPGGVTGHGHGFGSREVAERQARKRRAAQ